MTVSGEHGEHSIEIETNSLSSLVKRLNAAEAIIVIGLSLRTLDNETSPQCDQAIVHGRVSYVTKVVAGVEPSSLHSVEAFNTYIQRL
jgi:hypothetical protein